MKITILNGNPSGDNAAYDNQFAYFVLRIQRALRNTKYAIRSNPTKSQTAIKEK